MAIIGIDLGTTNCAVACVNGRGVPEILPNREGERITPSVVLFDGDAPIVGTLAKQAATTNAVNVVQFVKRQMGNPSWKYRTEGGDTFSAEDVSAIILKRLKEDAEAVLGTSVYDAVITVPAYFSDAQRKATHDAGSIAGLNVVRIINEPTAAGLAYAFKEIELAAGSGANVEKRWADRTALVYDLGGGTFDVTIMRIEKQGVRVIATGGDRNLGGFNWDNTIMEFLNAEFGKLGGVDLLNEPDLEQQLRTKAEIAKKTLSSRDSANVLLAGGGKSSSIVLTRATFEELTAPLLKRTANIMEFVREDAGLSWAEIDCVLLTGGSTRMRAVPTVVERTTAKRPSAELHPDEVVALGAALQGALLHDDVTRTKALPVVRVSDVNSHSLGVVAVDGNLRESNSIVLAKDTPIPCTVSSTFHTVQDNQTALHVQVTEGEDTNLAYVKIVGEGEMAIPPYPRGSPVEVQFEYDHDGIIHVRVFDLTGNKSLGELRICRNSNLTDDAVAQKALRLSRYQVG